MPKLLKYIVLSCFALTLLGEFYLLISGDKFLIEEHYLPKGPYVTDSSDFPILDRYGCIYFTGRKTIVKVIEATQFDGCPLFWREAAN
jgi:hypothetical protein